MKIRRFAGRALSLLVGEAVRIRVYSVAWGDGSFIEEGKK